jgi:biotin-(acetyl-CoA carboxylase) ligase
VPVEELPQETRLPATSLLVELGSAVDRAELLATLLAELERDYDAWLAATVGEGSR